MPTTESAVSELPFVVLHVPHASILIPASDRANMLLSDHELGVEVLRMTDRYTDELFAIGSADATTVMCPVSRLVVDMERFIEDAAEPMAAIGMGAVYTRTSHGATLRTPSDADERRRLLDRYYRPHHGRLTDAVNAAIDAWGSCLVIDCHSFPEVPLPYELDQSEDRPDICLGTDAFHTPRVLAESAQRIFEEAGFSVAMNRPFAGALVPAAHYRSDSRVMALMIEVNRRLYMDEQTGERRPDFATIQTRVQDVMRSVIAECRRGLHTLQLR